MTNPLAQAQFAIVARTIPVNTIFEFTGKPFEAANGAAGAWYVTNGGPHIYQTQVPGDSFFGSGSTYAPQNLGGFRINIESTQQTTNGVAVSFGAIGTISEGDLVELSSTAAFTVKRATGSNPIVGISVNNSG